MPKKSTLCNDCKKYGYCRADIKLSEIDFTGFQEKIQADIDRMFIDTYIQNVPHSVKYLNINENIPATTYYLSEAFEAFHKMKYQESITLFHDTLKVNKNIPDVYLGLAIAHFILKEYKQACLNMKKFEKKDDLFDKEMKTIFKGVCKSLEKKLKASEKQFKKESLNIMDSIVLEYY